MLELFGHFQKGEMKSSFLLQAQLCSGNMAVRSSSHPRGIPHSMSTQSVWHGGAAVLGRLFQMLLVVSSGGLLFVWWGAVRDSAVTTTVVKLALVPRHPQSIRCSLGAASAACEAAGRLEEGGCLLIRGPLLQAQSQFIASYRRLVLPFGLAVFKWHIAAMDLSFRVMVFWPPGVVFWSAVHLMCVLRCH